LGEDLFGHPVLLHSLQMTQPTYPLPLCFHFTIFSPLLISSSSLTKYICGSAKNII
jgi:hypothetical protein